MKLIRVFPRRTRATPTDDLAFVGGPTLFAEADAVHISVTFTWDIPEAERLEKEWRHVAPTMIGGPAMETRGEDFEPGKYLKPGYIITSRGCPNRCWFCSVWKHDGSVRELPIRDGWNVLDDNLLACSEAHIRAVFAMLARQKKRPEFTGGIEAVRMRPWIAAKMKELKSESIFFAYDTPNDLAPLWRAGQMMIEAGFTAGSHDLRCYVLMGFPGDDFEKAEFRLRETVAAGFFPMAMLYQPPILGRVRQSEWNKFQHQWTRPHIIAAKMKKA